MTTKKRVRKRRPVQALSPFMNGVLHAAKQVPMNWCDSLLTGPDGIGNPPYDCRAIEKLLRGVQDRIRSTVEPQS